MYVCWARLKYGFSVYGDFIAALFSLVPHDAPIV